MVQRCPMDESIEKSPSACPSALDSRGKERHLALGHALGGGLVEDAAAGASQLFPVRLVCQREPLLREQGSNGVEDQGGHPGGRMRLLGTRFLVSTARRPSLTASVSLEHCN